MDDQTRVLLRGAYQFLLAQQEEIIDMQIVTFALRKTIRELGPEAETIYAKHYLAESNGPLKRNGDGVLEAISQLMRQVSEPGS